jgi:hypothetical protein
MIQEFFKTIQNRLEKQTEKKLLDLWAEHMQYEMLKNELSNKVPILQVYQSVIELAEGNQMFEDVNENLPIEMIDQKMKNTTIVGRIIWCIDELDKANYTQFSDLINTKFSPRLESVVVCSEVELKQIEQNQKVISLVIVLFTNKHQSGNFIQLIHYLENKNFWSCFPLFLVDPSVLNQKYQWLVNKRGIVLKENITDKESEIICFILDGLTLQHLRNVIATFGDNFSEEFWNIKINSPNAVSLLESSWKTTYGTVFQLEQTINLKIENSPRRLISHLDEAEKLRTEFLKAIEKFNQKLHECLSFAVSNFEKTVQSLGSKINNIGHSQTTQEQVEKDYLQFQQERQQKLILETQFNQIRTKFQAICSLIGSLFVV